MPKPDPISLRLTQAALDAIHECTELSGLERSAVVETAIREYLARLRRADAIRIRSTDVGQRNR